MSIVRLLQFARGLMAASLVAAAAVVTPAIAQDDPPGRVGRVADLNGGVSWFDAEQGQWTDAERNRPFTSGDRISTAGDGRAELSVGSTLLRLAAGSEIEVLQLDDDKLVFQLHAGSVALRIRSREVADEFQLLTAEARLLPQRAGHYRVDRIDDSTFAAAWRGEIDVADTPWKVAAGQRIELVRENRGSDLRQSPARFADDDFAAWVLAEDSRDNERTASNRYVSPEMTGAEDLDRHGRWEQHPEYGAIWFPAVAVDWAPYRYGRWSWVRPWGWTWVDAAPWGFAPFHYGRWVHLRNHWGWVPGTYVARPVYAPALVAWIGAGAGWGVSVQIGGGPVGWVPLAPREAYRPHYRHTPVYVDRVNPGPRQHWQHPPAHGHDRRERPWVYGNQAVPGAVTVVRGDVLLRRQPVAGGVIDIREQRPVAGFPGAQRPGWQLAPTAPPPGPTTGVAPRADRRDERRTDRPDDRRSGGRAVERGDDPWQGRRDGRFDPPPRPQPQVPAAAAPSFGAAPGGGSSRPATPVAAPDPGTRFERDRHQERGPRERDGEHFRSRQPGFDAGRGTGTVRDPASPVVVREPAWPATGRESGPAAAPQPGRAAPPLPVAAWPRQAPPAMRAAPQPASVERAAPTPAPQPVAAPLAAAAPPPPAPVMRPPAAEAPRARERGDSGDEQRRGPGQRYQQQPR